MQQLDPSQPLDNDDSEAPAAHGPREIHVSLVAYPNVPGMPRIVTLGHGTNLDRACRDAIKSLFKDKRMKGRKAKTSMPIKATFQFDFYGNRDDE